MSDNERAQRFWALVARGTDEECWPWLGLIGSKGYGTTLRDRCSDVKVGPIPQGLELDHLCHTNDPSCRPPCPHRRCVNPSHLEPVTHLVNIQRAARKRVP